MPSLKSFVYSLCLYLPIFQIQAQPIEQTDYQQFCARCHLSIEIEQRLRNDWYGKSAEELFNRMRTTMPVDNPGSLSQEQYLALTTEFLNLGGTITPTRH